MERTNYWLLFAILCSTAVWACSAQSKSVKTETVYETSRHDESTPYGTVMKKTESTETHTEKSSEPSGILSGTVDLVGKTVALPFRVVAGLIDLAF